ncbi:MAG: SH3 domain-containing protein [Vicinamibacterales bacterium]
MPSRRSSSVLFWSSLLWCVGPAAHAQTLITTASSVRLRAEATTESRVLAELPLGTEIVTCDGAADGWLHVETADGRAGWIASALATEVTPERRASVIADLARSRLRRPAETLASRLELVALLERERASALERAPVRGPARERAAALDGGAPTFGDEGAARLELYWWKALEATLEAMPYGAHPSASLDAWLAAHEREVAYHDTKGRYVLKPEALHRAHDRWRGTSAAEDLLWLAVANGYPGECEGLLSCYIARADGAEGEYVRWYPEGRHLDEAMRRLLEQAAWWKLRVEQRYGFEPTLECREITPLLATLRFGVETASHPDRQKMVALIDDVRWRCQ